MTNKPTKHAIKLNIANDTEKDDYIHIDKRKLVIFLTIFLCLFISYNIFQPSNLSTNKDKIQLNPKIYKTKEYKLLKKQIVFYQNRIDIKLKELEILNNKITSGPITF